MISAAIRSFLNIKEGKIEGAPIAQRHLSDLAGIFADSAAYDEASAKGDPLVYAVSSVEPTQGDGQLHYAVGTLMPGHIGREYYMTKGHYHAWRAAAEVYLGLSGEGLMLLEDEKGESRLLALTPNALVYVPGFTAHRTINTGPEPLTYIGIYPADAGHDYAAIAKKNFRNVVIETKGKPEMLDRAAYKL
jgi:glucose-6-phosphate isomerase, archaeal